MARTNAPTAGRALILVTAALLALASCTATRQSAPASPVTSSGESLMVKASVTWTKLSAVPGARELSWVTSGGDQVLVSGLRGTGDAAPPGLWRAGRHGRWQAVALVPTTYYGRRANLFRVATDGRRVVALGRRIGGTHGNPRFTSWTGSIDRLTETAQPFELFGGPDAIAVTDLGLTRHGAVVIGAWSRHRDPSGVTLWRQHGDSWRRFDHEPGLASEVTDVGSDLTSPAAVTSRGGEPVLVGWTVHLAGGHVRFRASLWQPQGPAWQEVRLPSSGDAVARAVTCSDVCTVVGAIDDRLALWDVRGSVARSVAVPDLPVGEREPVLVTSGGSTVWLTVAEGSTTHVLRVVDDQVALVPSPPGIVTSLAGLRDRVVAVVRGTDGTTAVWQAG